jgi:ABC-2 type transport system ATP-binding protein
MSRPDIDAVLARVGLQGKAFGQRLRTFSKGMRQKLGIAIAIVKDARNILLDEPTGGLDPKAGAEFMALLGQLRGEGRAILMSTHDIFRAKDAADRVGIMKDGRLVRVLTRAELAVADLERLYIEYVEAA